LIGIRKAHLDNQELRVGLSAMIFKDGRVLFGKRRGSHGAGEYSWPGGRMEYGESIIEAIKREIREETGMEVKDVRFLGIQNLRQYPPKHYIDISFTAQWESGEPKLMEPEKCEGWGWYFPNDFPSPFFGTIEDHLKMYYDNGPNFIDD
jgi:8-oxo-dGTP diphosphatase